jgi:hypothetical protein
MTEPTLESLAKRIEKKLAVQQPSAGDWPSVVGTFDDDPEFMQQVLAEALAIREAERKAARGGRLEWSFLTKMV